MSKEIMDLNGLIIYTHEHSDTLSGACLVDLDLRQADLIDRDLEDTNFSGTDLSGADLSWAGLDGAVFNGAGLQGTGLTKEILIKRGASFDRKTVFGAIDVVVPNRKKSCPHCGQGMPTQSDLRKSARKKLDTSALTSAEMAALGLD